MTDAYIFPPDVALTVLAKHAPRDHPNPGRTVLVQKRKCALQGSTSSSPEGHSFHPTASLVKRVAIVTPLLLCWGVNES
ncbi:hypothetical protein EYZ11_010503 [Aspergillus tanneri]|uniref:Uncharacterized protein n=1 Tax=Aspergillus tanneri TaxID=1220188 RepID=A0A4V3UN67_9EURO|nr:hypothetical protein EYZ11_010503 [Aspergillus tanneri]